MSKATENILEFMSLTADIANNAADYRLKQNELDLINEEAQLKRVVAVNANEYKENLTAEKESSKASLQASLDSIDEYKDKLELYDVMQQDYLKLPEEYRTEDGKSTLDDLGIRHLGGYNFATKTANTLDEKLKYEENLTELMSEISRDSAEAYRNVLNLRKTVLTKTGYSNVINTSFSELVTPPPPLEETISVEQFFDLYNSIFYDIPAEGDINSHQFLIERSREYVGVDETMDEEIQVLLDEITTLRQNLLDTEQELIQLQTSTDQNDTTISSNVSQESISSNIGTGGSGGSGTY